MYNFNGFSPEISFFGACNSFEGFKSMFPTIFEPKKYSRIFILKGGPGTGKSSLMRSVGAYYSRLGFCIDAIYCSSDPSSLDGVIIKKGEYKIAIIDGTSPHATEAKFPGLIERTTNLEESINSSVLELSRELILDLNKRKAKGYTNAYLALASCGHLFSIIKDEISELSRNITADISKTYHLDSVNRDKSNNGASLRLESSFSKFGLTSLKENEENKKVVSLGHNPILCGIVLKMLCADYLSSDDIITICPSPLSSEMIDRVYTKDYVFECCDDNDSPTIDLDSLCSPSPFALEVMACYNKCLDIARSWMVYASEQHFALEDIYKRSMDFENNERIYEKIICEMNTILGI